LTSEERRPRREGGSCCWRMKAQDMRVGVRQDKKGTDRPHYLNSNFEKNAR